MRPWEGELSPLKDPSEGTNARRAEPDARVAQLLAKEAILPSILSESGPPEERTEAGRMPPGRLEQTFARMISLLHEGRFEDVRSRLAELLLRYPGDLLLARQVAEFHIETGDKMGALSALFTVARRLFEHENLTELRRTLEKILLLDPSNQRAFRLLGLLDHRSEAERRQP